MTHFEMFGGAAPLQIIGWLWAIFAIYWFAAAFRQNRVQKREPAAERFVHILFHHGHVFVGGGVENNFNPVSQKNPAHAFRVREVGDTEYRALVVFSVTSVQMYAKDDFPTKAVYGATPDPELRLITCGGTFDYETRSYLSNTVVYATEIRQAA